MKRPDTTDDALRASLVLSIDPGIRGCGAALWLHKRLVAAAYVKSPASKGSGPREAVDCARAVAEWMAERSKEYRFFPPATVDLAVEWPQTYGGRASRGDANDLFALSGIDSALCALLEPDNVKSYAPREWKGALQKPASVNSPYPVEAMVLRRLDESETKAVELPTNKRLHWDVWDAVGVGLKHVGRFDKLKVYPRE